jgi:hypothetical protein
MELPAVAEMDNGLVVLLGSYSDEEKAVLWDCCSVQMMVA